MKILKTVLSKVIPFIIILLLPAILMTVMSESIPNQYGKTFLAGLPVKYERLYTVDSPKVIVVGGSNVAFGMASELMEKQLGRPCVNF